MKAIAVSCWILAACLLVASLQRNAHWGTTRPTSPAPELGQVWELNNHGNVRYVTAGEFWELRGSFAAALLLALAGGWSWRRAKRGVAVSS